MRRDHRVWMGALGIRPHRRDDLVMAVHVVIGRRHDIGPVRLDIGQVQQERFITLFFHEFNRPAGHVGRFGILFPDAGGQMVIAEIPARQDFAVGAFGRIGPVMPRIVAVIALRFQVPVIGVVRIDQLVGPQPVIAFHRLQPAFGGEHAELGELVDTEPRHAFGVGLHMGFADERAAQALGADEITDIALADRERHAVPGRPVAVDVAPGQVGHARRPAERRLHEGTGEVHALRGKPVDMRRFQMRVSVAGQVIPAQLVAHDEENIFCCAHIRRLPVYAFFLTPGAKTGHRPNQKGPTASAETLRGPPFPRPTGAAGAAVFRRPDAGVLPGSRNSGSPRLPGCPCCRHACRAR